MEGFARYALFGCIVASGVGGAVVSIVAFKYGLVPPAEDDPIAVTHRRLFVTHLGHAIAAIAFAATTVLAVAVLMSGAAGPRDQRDLQVIAQRLDELDGIVRRLTDALEHAVERFERRRISSAAP
jgi:hypothetical protein